MSRRTMKSRSRSPVRNASPLTEENQQFVESLRRSPTFSKSPLPSRSPQTFSEEDYPVTIEDPIRPTLDEDQWTTVIKKSRKQRGLEHEPIPDAPLTVSLENPDQLQQAQDALLQHRRHQRKERRHTQKTKVKNAQAFNKVRWSKGEPRELKGKYIEELEKGLVAFFRPGYERYTDELRAECGLAPVENASGSHEEVLECIRTLFIKYGIVVSGGFVLKFIKQMDDMSKPSVDCDMYVPHTSPVRFPTMYDSMAKLFCCDVIPDMHGHMHNDIDAFITHKMQGTRTGFLQKNGIFSVHKHKRNVGGVYAEMDLVRASLSRTPVNIVRNFDLSVVMNWYDGERLLCMNPDAIFDSKHVTSFLQYSYVPIYLGIGSANMVNVARGRVLKYIMRGYRISYVNPHSGEVTEITVADMPNTLKQLINTANRNARPKVLQKALLTLTAKMRRKLLQNHPSLSRHDLAKSPKKKAAKIEKKSPVYQPSLN